MMPHRLLILLNQGKCNRQRISRHARKESLLVMKISRVLESRLSGTGRKGEREDDWKRGGDEGTDD